MKAIDSIIGVGWVVFWAYWLDGKPSSVGICEGELSSGESILFFPECFSEVGACPAAPNPLGISAPAVAERGAPIEVSVISYANASGAQPKPLPRMDAGRLSVKAAANGPKLTVPGAVRPSNVNVVEFEVAAL